MKAFIVNQFNLNQIQHFTEDKCSDTLAFLRYILKRTEDKHEKQEIENYMAQIESRCQELRTSNAA